MSTSISERNGALQRLVEVADEAAARGDRDAVLEVVRLVLKILAVPEESWTRPDGVTLH